MNYKQRQAQFKRVKTTALLWLYDSDTGEHLTQYARNRLLWLAEKDFGLYANISEITTEQINNVMERTASEIRRNEDYRKTLPKYRGFGKKTMRAICAWLDIEIPSAKDERIALVRRQLHKANAKCDSYTTLLENWSKARDRYAKELSSLEDQES